VPDQGVFNIMVGTAITLAIADGSKADGELADVTYVDAWQEGLFGRKAKLDWLVGGSEAGELPNAVAINRAELEDWRPAPFQNGEWLSIREIFSFSLSGLQTKRDHFVYSPDREILAERVVRFRTLEGAPARELFHDSRDRKWVGASTIPFDNALISKASYRPLDLRYLYNHRAYGDFLRPELQSAWGEANVGLYTMPFGVGAGPGVWSHGYLPDYHLFSGRGGYAFPLYDRRAGPDVSNLNPVLVAALSEAYGAAQSPEDIFDVILALLSAKSYSRRFAEDLEDVFPHIPFPADPAVFAQAAAIGCEIRGLEAFQREPVAAFRPKSLCKIVVEPNGIVATSAYRDGEINLCENGTGRMTGIPESVWSFSVSGYRVLPRWIEGRKGLPATLALMRELRDVAARIAELIHWFDAADLVLEATLADTLTREKLGFPAAAPEEAGEGDD